MIIVLLFSSGDTFSQTVETVKGVRVVHNDQSMLIDDFKTGIELIRTIGGKKSKYNGLSFSYPFDAAVAPNGNVYIADAGNDRVVILDQSGNYISSFGEKGLDPGQFSSPVSIDIDNSDNIFVGDREKISVQRFSPEGDFTKEFDGGEGVDFLRVLNSGRIVMGNGVEFSYFGETERQRRNPLAKIFDTSGNIKERIGEPLVYEVKSTLIADRSFSFAVDMDDFIYLTFAHRNLIEKYGAKGKIKMRIDRNLNYPETRITLKKGIEELGSERPNYISAGIDVGGQERIWVMTYTRQKNGRDAVSGNTESDLFELEVFNSEGILIGKIQPGIYFDRFRIFGERLFLIDTMKGMYLNEYKIVN